MLHQAQQHLLDKRLGISLLLGPQQHMYQYWKDCAFEANGKGAQCGFQAIQPDSTDGTQKELMGMQLAQK